MPITGYDVIRQPGIAGATVLTRTNYRDSLRTLITFLHDNNLYTHIFGSAGNVLIPGTPGNLPISGSALSGSRQNVYMFDLSKYLTDRYELASRPD